MVTIWEQEHSDTRPVTRLIAWASAAAFPGTQGTPFCLPTWGWRKERLCYDIPFSSTQEHLTATQWADSYAKLNIIYICRGKKSIKNPSSIITVHKKFFLAEAKPHPTWHWSCKDPIWYFTLLTWLTTWSYLVKELPMIIAAHIEALAKHPSWRYTGSSLGVSNVEA